MKLILFIKKIILLLMAFLLVICSRIISPFLTLRFGILDIGRIGGYYIADSYLSNKRHKKFKIRFFDIFLLIKSSSHVNETWLKMWDKKLIIFHPLQMGSYIIYFNKILPGYKNHIVPAHPSNIGFKQHAKYYLKNKKHYYSQNVRLKNILNSKKPNIYFDKKDELIGIKALKEIKISKNKPFICFHNRDPAFLDTVLSEKDWSYHDFRDSDIKNYIPAMKDMTKKGYQSVRIGYKVKEKINSLNPNIIDYAGTKIRTDFLDIFLLKKCKFLVCSDTGISFPAEVFKQPIVYVNWTILDRLPTYTSNGLIIFKKFFSMKKNRFLSFKEMKKINLVSGNPKKILKEKGIKLIENSAQDILEVTNEMNDKLNKVWIDKPKNDMLQEKFWDLFSPKLVKSPNLKIGSKFLDINKEVLF